MADDGPFAAVVAAVGSPIRDLVTPLVTTATEDSIRHFARGYGDGNPLYSDPEYARGVRGVFIAPPLFPLASGTPTWSEPADGRVVAAVDIDRMPGVRNQTIMGDSWVLCRPIVEGTRLQRDRRLEAAVPLGADGSPVASVAEAAGCDITERMTYHADGEVFAVYERHRRYRLERAPSTRKRRTARYVNTAEELARVEAAYDAEVVRGATPRHVDSVAVGDQLGPVVKGPLTMTDLVEYRAGVGPGPLGGAALRLGYLNRRSRPALYNLDLSGTPDITERRHWDDLYAQSEGYPAAYDYSHTRLNWLVHVLTNWAGDGGWVREIAGTTTIGDNFLGDTHWLDGEVVSVDQRDGIGVVHVRIWGDNQLGERTCEATAVVLLPAAPNTVVSTEQIVALGQERLGPGFSTRPGTQ